MSIPIANSCIPLNADCLVHDAAAWCMVRCLVHGASYSASSTLLLLYSLLNLHWLLYLLLYPQVYFDLHHKSTHQSTTVYQHVYLYNPTRLRLTLLCFTNSSNSVSIALIVSLNSCPCSPAPAADRARPIAFFFATIFPARPS